MNTYIILDLCGMKLPELSSSCRRKAVAFAAKPQRSLDFDATVVPWLRKQGKAEEHLMAVEILSDSELVVNWILGQAKVNETYCRRIAAVQNDQQSSWQAGLTSPRLPWMEVIRHIYRELNDLADGVAKEAWSRRTSYWKEFPAMGRVHQSTPKYLRIFTDGSHRDGLASRGIVVSGPGKKPLWSLPTTW